jgi:hypothetical protein
MSLTEEDKQWIADTIGASEGRLTALIDESVGASESRLTILVAETAQAVEDRTAALLGAEMGSLHTEIQNVDRGSNASTATRLLRWNS